MLVKVDPVSANSNALLVWHDFSMTANQLYTPSQGAPDTDTLYVVSNTDKARHVTVRRGTHGEGIVVANIHYPGLLQRRKNGTVQFADAVGEAVKFTDWMSNFGRQGHEHRVSIAGDNYTWVERKRNDTFVVYPLMKGNTTIATFVPTVVDKPKGSLNHIATRPHLEFSGPQLPDERIIDGIVVSALVIQHTIMLSHTSGSGVWWWPFDVTN